MTNGKQAGAAIGAIIAGVVGGLALGGLLHLLFGHKCPNCDQPVVYGTNICPHCGIEIRWD